jgi:hypothetical protein
MLLPRNPFCRRKERNPAATARNATPPVIATSGSDAAIWYRTQPALPRRNPNQQCQSPDPRDGG